MTLAAVSDAGPLIHLAEIDSLELLSTFDTLLVPETVYKEVEAGGIPDQLADLSYELVEADDSQLGAEQLDAGERAANTTPSGRQTPSNSASSVSATRTPTTPISP